VSTHGHATEASPSAPRLHLTERISGGVGTLCLMTQTTADSVRRVLVDSDAIAALGTVLGKHDRDVFEGPNYVTFEGAQITEHSGEALSNLGLQEISVMNNPEYDGDDTEDRGPIESPPFDIRVLLDLSLSSAVAPGWSEEDSTFKIDPQQSQGLEKQSGQPFFCPTVPGEGHNDCKTRLLVFLGGTLGIDRDKSCIKLIHGSDALRIIRSFLRPIGLPAVGHHVCIHVKLPFGGRGYIYGPIKEIAQPPSDELLRATDPVFGKGCPCSDPNCKIKKGTRDEMIAALGAVTGQKLKAVVSLDPGHPVQEKLRNAPLPAFFRGKQAKYTVTLQFMPPQIGWKVVHITSAEQ